MHLWLQSCKPGPRSVGFQISCLYSLLPNTTLTQGVLYSKTTLQCNSLVTLTFWPYLYSTFNWRLTLTFQTRNAKLDPTVNHPRTQHVDYHVAYRHASALGSATEIIDPFVDQMVMFMETCVLYSNKPATRKLWLQLLLWNSVVSYCYTLQIWL